MDIPDNDNSTPLPNLEFAPDIDFEGLGNARNWLRTALKKSGATITGSGYGAGGADVDIELDGMPFNIAITPRPLAS